MKFAPMSEKAIAEANIWPAGVYDFEIIEAEDTTSKAGNEMMALKVRIYSEEGGTQLVDDYLVDTPKAAFKVRHCADAVGLIAQYEEGELMAHALKNRTGKCKVIVVKDRSGQYPDKNGIGDYVKLAAPASGGAGLVNTAPPKPRDLDDEIPF